MIDDETGGRHVFVVDGSRLYELDPSTRRPHGAGGRRPASAARRCRGSGSPVIRSWTIDRSPPRRACHLARGRAEVQSRLHLLLRAAGRLRRGVANMSLERPALDRPAARWRRCRASVSTSRSSAASRWSTARCSARRPSTPWRGRRRLGVEVRFSITTNGTLVNAADVEFFERHGFAVTISLDGDREHPRRAAPVPQRPRLSTTASCDGASAAGAAASACRCRRGSR